MTLFDVLAGLLLFISALTAFMRGATKELTGMLAFIIAALIAIYALRFSAPVLRGMMSPDWAAVTAALLIVFVVVFLVLKIIGGQITRGVQSGGALGTLDRLIGAAFGLIRAMVILGAFTLLVQLAGGETGPPRWVSEARLYPLTVAAGKVLKAFAPSAFAAAGKVAPAVKDAVRDGAGYSDAERRTMDDAVEKSR
ncbi:MAG: CvpA family protein [Caulobacteraceae bacterium]|nr:MAG: CvpA family protein [Caulobacteraceae bacterium]